MRTVAGVVAAGTVLLLSALSLGAHLSPVEILLLAALAGVAWPVPPRSPEPR